MTYPVTWMWFGNGAQINATAGSPATAAEAESMNGYTATGPNQIEPVSLVGGLRVIKTPETGWTTAYATTYNHNLFGPSTFSYRSPDADAQVSSQITGFLRVDYRLTFPDNTTSDQQGVLIQMRNGDMFFRPALDSVDEWSDINALYSVEILQATPLPANTYVARISFNPDIFDLDIICFAAGTMILTEQGDRAVETLQAGDMIWTRDNGFQPLRWTGTRALDAIDLAAKPKLRPVRIEAGALGADQPVRPLVVSRQHRILIRSAIAQRIFGAAEVLAPACQLTELPGIRIDEDVTQVTYVHLMFDDHQVIMSDGALTESLYPGAQAIESLGKTALAEIDALFPQLRDATRLPREARHLVRGPQLRRLVERHARNERALVS